MSSYLSYFSRDASVNFSYEIGEKIPGLDSAQSIWSIHEAKLKKAPHTKATMFVYDIKAGSVSTEVAKKCFKRIRTLRHPNIVTYIEGLESEKYIYIATEYVTPLSTYLDQITDSRESTMAISWGLHQVVNGLSFLVNQVNLIHNNVCLSSIFIDRAGEWKLFGLEYMFNGEDEPPIKVSHGLDKYEPPEKSSRKRSCLWSSDMWGLACLIWEAFNGVMPSSNAMKQVGKIPKNLIPHWAELVSANPVKRPNPEKFIANCRERKQFMDNMFVDCNLFLEEIQIKDQDVRTAFLERLGKNLDHFPKDYARFKILPCLINAYQFGGAGAAALGPIFKLGQLLNDDDYQRDIVPCLVKMFSSTDRATRIQLLRQIEYIVCHLKKDIINKQIFPSLVSGFHDSAPLIREATIKSMLHVADKLDANNINVELMKHFARLQARDDQGPIRTNTTVCLGKILQYLNKDTKHKVAVSAFARSMKDPFPPARAAGVRAMVDNIEEYQPKDIALRVLPAICGLMVDPDKSVREAAFASVHNFTSKLEEISKDPAEMEKLHPTQKVAGNSDVSASKITSVSSPVPAPGWAGFLASSAVNLTMAAASAAANTATSKFRKAEQGKISPEIPEVVVAKSAISSEEITAKSEPSKTPGGMKLQSNKGKTVEINWDEIHAENMEDTVEPIKNWENADNDLDDADWGDNWNDDSKKTSFSKKKVVKKVTKKKAAEKSSTDNSVIIEDIPASMSALGLNSSFTETKDDENWSFDWGTPVKQVPTAAQKKLEREAKMKARKVEMEKRRAAKKTVKLGVRKAD